jgi:hypothetical protein
VKKFPTLAALLAGALLAASGCSSIEGETKKPNMLIPAKELNVSSSLSIPAESLVAGGIIFLIVDPLAPNWKVQIEPMGTRLYRVELTMKRFITGGEGESYQVIRRTAEKLRREGGFNDYFILEQSEGIESRVTIAQRVAHAVVELR